MFMKRVNCQFNDNVISMNSVGVLLCVRLCVRSLCENATDNCETYAYIDASSFAHIFHYRNADASFIYSKKYEYIR